MAMLKHIVLFKFKPTATPAQRQELAAALNALPAMIADIKGWQVVASVPGRPERYAHLALFSEFDDVAALDRYIVHPQHKKIVELVEAYCESRASFDYV